MHLIEVYLPFHTHLWGSLALTMIWTHSLLLKALSIHDFCACEKTTTTKKSPHQSSYGTVSKGSRQTGRSESRQELCMWGSSSSAKQSSLLCIKDWKLLCWWKVSLRSVTNFPASSGSVIVDSRENVYITETWLVWKHALYTSAFEYIYIFLSNVIQQPKMYCTSSTCKTQACTSAHMLMRH